ncbi:hypothetical protein Tco_1532907 [Tanacetum coccineum]
MLFRSCPTPSSGHVGVDVIYYLKESSTELYYIEIYYEKHTRNIQKKPNDVYLFKVDMTSINLEEMECLKNWVIADTGYSGYNDLNNSDTINEIPKEFDFTVLDMSREIWEEIDDLKDAIRFIDLARDYSVSYIRVIASELGGFIYIRGEMGGIIYSYHVKTNTISLFPIPSTMMPTSHVLMWECRLEGDHREAKSIAVSKMIMELCVGEEYMNFCATCKQCLLAASLIKWSNETSLRRLQMYSLVSPWLMSTSVPFEVLITNEDVVSSKRKEPTWRKVLFGTHLHNVFSSTFYDGALYALGEQGELIVINNLGKEDYYS